MGASPPVDDRAADSRPDGDGGGSRRALGRFLGSMTTAASLLALLWTLLPHDGADGDRLVQAMVAVGVCAGLAMLAGALDHAPDWAPQAAIAALQVVISVGYLAPGVASNDLRLLFVWSVPVAAFFFTPRAVVGHGIFGATCLTVSLALMPEPTPVLLRVWLLTVGTAAALAVVVSFGTAAARRSRRALLHLAWHDGLSGLPNRVLFERRVDEALRERGTTGRVHVMLVDLDHFKLVNDTYGHHAGDELITAVSARLNQALREVPGATAARMGGDEFAVVVGDPDASLDLDAALLRFREALQQPVRLSGVVVPVSASVGVATGTEPGCTAEDLLRDADVALYRAKRTQRGSVRRYDGALRVEVERRTRLDHELHGALARGELSLAYQPVVELPTGRTTGAEALLRWNSPGLGPVPPSEFVPVAEDNGLVVPIGRWVLERAAEDVAAWRRQGAVDDGFTVAVNVSVRQLGAGFPDELRALLLHHQLPASALTVEVTESVLMDGTVWSGSVLSRLRAGGTRVSLDDFGTGYSSLSYLQRMPMDILKIDRAFVGELDGAVPRTGLVSAVVDLARSLGMDVVAEGVETPEQAEVLRLLGVDLAQGWLFARPLPAGDLVSHLQQPVRPA